jgi:nicotinic acid mononucleotide adenylyltransferase
MILYEFSKEIANEIISPRVVVIYAGRFQPFHINHYEAYKYLVNKFDADNV